MKFILNYIRKEEWSPYVAGVLLGLVGIGAVWASNNLLGASGAFENIAGMILNRFNVSWFAVKHPDPLFYVPTFMSNVDYFPTFPEVSVSIGIFAAGIMAFGLIAKYFPVFEDEHPVAHAGD